MPAREVVGVGLDGHLIVDDGKGGHDLFKMVIGSSGALGVKAIKKGGGDDQDIDQGAQSVPDASHFDISGIDQA